MIARSRDGERLETVLTLDQDHFGAQWTERPALVRTRHGGWRMYVSCATPDTKHWWIGVARGADARSGWPTAEVRTAFAGDEQTAVKDPIVRRADGVWHAWVCCHLLDLPGAEDRMNSAYATSADGLDWDWHGTVLEGRQGEWDARGARLTTILPDGRAAYDGRATRGGELVRAHGLALPGRRPLRLDRRRRSLDARYLEALPLPGRRAPHLLRGAPARREPRAAHRAALQVYRAARAGRAGRHSPVLDDAAACDDGGMSMASISMFAVHQLDARGARSEVASGGLLRVALAPVASCRLAIWSSTSEKPVKRSARNVELRDLRRCGPVCVLSTSSQ